MGGKTIVPNLIVAQRVLDHMADAAERYLEDETGEAMVGLVLPGENTNGVPTVYLLDTIAPDESAIREAYTFQQGDERQDEFIWWLHQNWEIERARKRKSGKTDKWDSELRHIGDWHKQPGYMIAPSGGDLMTAIDMLDDRDRKLDFLIAPILTLGHPATTGASDGHANFLTVPGDDGFVRVDFWYIDKYSRMFLPIAPAVYPDKSLPKLVDYPWHLVDSDRFVSERAQLQGDGLFTSVLTWDVDDKAPVEVCFMVGRQGASKLFIIVTQVDFPESRPVAYAAPFMSMKEGEVIYDVFKRMWPQAEKLKDPPGWKWTPERYLIDYVHALEDMLGIKRPEKTVPADPQPDSAEPADAQTKETP
jgi:hypothetical protein